MRKLVKLIAPPGTDECNFGTERYRVHEDGTVVVPREAVEGLTTKGGFAIAKDQPADGGA